MGETNDVRYETRGRVAWLTIDRPERRNALRAETIEGLLAGLERAGADAEVRAICLTGAGEAAFCSGADLAAAGGDLSPLEGLRRYAELLKAMGRCPRPIVARVAGHVVGGGMGLLLASDLAYASEDVKVGTPEVKVGLFPMMVAALLLRAGARKKLLELVYTGELVTARQAEAMGLLTRVHPRGELDQAVEGTLAAVASRAPLALALGRRALAEAERLELEPALDHLAGSLERLLATEDATEGMAAFAERREPAWKGR